VGAAGFRFRRRSRKDADAEKYGAWAETVRAAFRRNYVAGGRVGKGLQDEQAFGLYHRLIPEADRPAALSLVCEDLAKRGNALTTGIFGTPYLLKVLSAEGLDELAGRMVMRRAFPGWGYMLDGGATTLWETWKPSDNVYSQNHPMFGSVDAWLMEHALGLAVPEDAVGCDRVVIRPQPLPGLSWARGEYRSIREPSASIGVRTEGT
jgi:alpha-L-rhamnosidase